MPLFFASFLLVLYGRSQMGWISEKFSGAMKSAFTITYIAYLEDVLFSLCQEWGPIQLAQLRLFLFLSVATETKQLYISGFSVFSYLLINKEIKVTFAENWNSTQAIFLCKQPLWPLDYGSSDNQSFIASYFFATNRKFNY